MIDENNPWIEWRGGTCPVGIGMRVDVRFRNGKEIFYHPAIKLEWGHGSGYADIVRYRVAKRAPDKAPIEKALEQRALDRQEGGDHYKKLAIQPIEYCHRNNLGTCESFVVKYVTRWRDKGGIEDLKKARHTLDLLIEMETNA